jgi:putative oxidoreductase
MSMNTSSTVFPRTKSKGLNIALWVAQSLLAALFLFSGGFKLVNPGMVKDLPLALVYFIGTMEVLGVLGILLPSMLRIKPMLTPLAALGLAVILVFAAIYHFSRGEGSHTPPIFLFLALAIFVAWGRYKKVPIQPK